MRTLLAVAASAMLTACVTPVRELTSMLQQTPVCCTGYGEFKYIPLEIDKPRSVRLAKESPAFAFDSGKSYFYAARLPPYSSPLLLTIESEGVVAGEDRTSVFRPEVMFLDDQYRVTRRIAGETFKRSNTAMLSGAVFINSDNAAEAYVVIFTRTANGGDREMVKTFTPHMISLGGPAITVNGSENAVSLSYGPSGLVTLALHKYEPQRIAK